MSVCAKMNNFSNASYLFSANAFSNRISKLIRMLMFTSNFLVVLRCFGVYFLNGDFRSPNLFFPVHEFLFSLRQDGVRLNLCNYFQMGFLFDDSNFDGFWLRLMI